MPQVPKIEYKRNLGHSRKERRTMAIAKCIQGKYKGMPKHLRHNLKVGKTYLVEDIFISISGNRQAKIKLFGKKCLYIKSIFYPYNFLLNKKSKVLLII